MLTSIVLKIFRIPAALLAISLLTFACARAPSYPEATEREGKVIISLEGMEGATPRFYTYREGGETVNFFVLLVNGSVEAYLDACAKCGPKKRGYRVSGEDLVCNACGVSYPLDSLRGIGSCHPIALNGTTEGGYYIINKSELEKALN